MNGSDRFFILRFVCFVAFCSRNLRIRPTKNIARTEAIWLYQAVFEPGAGVKTGTFAGGGRC